MRVDLLRVIVVQIDEGQVDVMQLDMLREDVVIIDLFFCDELKIMLIICLASTSLYVGQRA